MTDYAEVIQEVDAVVDEMDVPPLQVVIDAMILSVKLTDEMNFGVNFAMLSSANKDLVVSGNGRTLNNPSRFPGNNTSIVPPMGEFIADAAKRGVPLTPLSGVEHQKLADEVMAIDPATVERLKALLSG